MVSTKNVTMMNIAVRTVNVYQEMELEDGTSFLLSTRAVDMLEKGSGTTSDQLIQMLGSIGAKSAPKQITAAPVVVQQIAPPAPVVEEKITPPAPSAPKVSQIMDSTTRPLNDAEMLAALKAKGVAGKGSHWLKTAKLMEKCIAAGIPLYTNGTPAAPVEEKKPAAPKPQQNNGGSQKPKGNYKPKNDGKDEDGETVFVGDNEMIWIWRKDHQKVFQVQIVEEVHSEEKGDGWKILMENKKQPEHLAEGWKVGKCWRVYSKDLPTNEDIAEFSKSK